jgi:predicted ATP-grasp superfamily ATP-dependent carboligase
MNPRKSSLSGKTVAVVGFNARPIACSAKKAGANVLVSDYWGDSDLATCSDEWTAVLKPTPGLRQRKRQELPVHTGLVKNLVNLVGDRGVDHVFVGSGFDDRSSSLEIIDDRWGITGNSPQLMIRARDTDRLARLAIELFGWLCAELL